MSNLLKELEKCRERWLEAKRKKDTIMMRLWERVGKKLKERVLKAHLVSAVRLKAV